MADGFVRWTAVNADGEMRYEVQTRLVGDVLAAPAPELQQLLASMRSAAEPCLYLAGSRLDNGFAFGSRDIGLAISVLPEDGLKAATPAYHPGSTELYVLIEGELVLESLEDGAVRQRACRQHEIAIVPPGQCHRIRRQSGKQAASLIVKTNLAFQPAVVRCPDCLHYRTPEQCPLHISWAQETGSGVRDST
jgi:mannose-6-phosphate isomerase-like protein (cupin superfamily)